MFPERDNAVSDETTHADDIQVEAQTEGEADEREERQAAQVTGAPAVGPGFLLFGKCAFLLMPSACGPLVVPCGTAQGCRLRNLLQAVYHANMWMSLHERYHD